MATMTDDRRRNAYPGTCCVCRAEVPAGAGWLYCDTQSSTSRSRHRVSRRWLKKVKCDRCHSAGLTSRWQADRLDNPPPPSPRSWSAPEVRRLALEAEVERSIRLEWPDPKSPGVAVPFTLVHVHVTIGGERFRLAGPEPISGAQCGPGWTMEDRGLAGRPFSKAAWEALGARVRETIEAHRHDLG